MTRTSWRRLILLFALAAAPQARADTLKESETLFSSGDFDASAKKVNELLLDEERLKGADRAKLFLMKARLELAFGRKHDVKLWLEKAYQADATLALDPVLDPPALQAILTELKRAPKPVAPPPAADAEPTHAAMSVAAGLLPFGFGHDLAGRYRDGALFLSSELLVLLAANTLPSSDEPEDRRTQHPRAREIIGGTFFLGLYGYEVGDRLNDVAGIRTFLDFFPLGAPQAKNGEPAKALAFAAAQSMLVTAGALAPRPAQRNMALGAAAVAWAYGVIDGFVNDRSAPPVKKSAAIVPFYSGKAMGLTAAIAF